MLRYSQEALEDMASKIDLLEYASKSEDFTRHSQNTYYCLCPFHNEKTPSLAINVDENFFHCFSCGKSGNIYKWIQWTEGLTFGQAVQKVADITGSNINEYIESETLAFYKLLQRLAQPKKETNPNRTYLDIDKDYKLKFKDEIPEEWVKEGINPDTLKKYEIMVDVFSNRVIYPVRDSNFNMIGIKGRTRFENYKELKIMKYMNYHRVGILDYFTGAMQASDYIDKTKEIIIVEGIKSVMKLDQWGFHNVVSAETSSINDYQTELLIRMGVRDVVIAFDKDVPIKKIEECTGLLKRFTNVFVVYDRWKLLSDKDSPPDKGENVWRMLYERRVKI